MSDIKLPYGKEKLSINIPDDRLAGLLVSKANSYTAREDEMSLVRDAIENPIDSIRLKELVKGKNNIVMIASDHTRPVPSKVITPVLLKEIEDGNPDATLTVLIATCFHRLTTKDELIYKFGEDTVNNKKIKFIVHDSSKNEDMIDLGTLPSGGKLLINKNAVNCDLLISEGFIEPHFFAGFSGGRKSVLPGVSSRTTVLANHCSEFIADEHARAGVLKDNPIHKDMVYAAKKANLAFIVNVVLDENKRVIKAFAGDYVKAHEKGCEFVDALSGVDAIPSDIVISTNGGYPLDQNIYQSVKGMTAAEATCNPGGVIIMVTNCIDGHGGQSLYDTFANEKSEEKIMQKFLATGRNETVPDQWESQILCRILLKYKVIMVTKAPKDMVHAMHMDYAENVPEEIKMADEYLEKQGKKNSKITVIPDGVSVIVRY